jgi:hypothetical protein
LARTDDGDLAHSSAAEDLRAILAATLPLAASSPTPGQRGCRTSSALQPCRDKPSFADEVSDASRCRGIRRSSSAEILPRRQSSLVASGPSLQQLVEHHVLALTWLRSVQTLGLARRMIRTPTSVHSAVWNLFRIQVKAVAID